MKQFILPALFCLMIASCSKGDVGRITVYELEQNPGWSTESFKTNYTIQFPSGFTGSMTGFEGNVFDKANADLSTHLWYGYSNSLICFDFRDTLPNINQPFIQVMFNGQVLTLSDRIEFTSNHELIGIFYHTDAQQINGRLFWKDDGVFKEAADANYLVGDEQQMIRILRSVQHR
ncbi:MAG: hypothetical protein ABI480_00550 [Chitinophagaceae bacterium]